MLEDAGQGGAEVEITRPMIRAAMRLISESGKLAQPAFGLAVLSEKILRAALDARVDRKRSTKDDAMPSKIAISIDRRL